MPDQCKLEEGAFGAWTKFAESLSIATHTQKYKDDPNSLDQILTFATCDDVK